MKKLIIAGGIIAAGLSLAACGGGPAHSSPGSTATSQASPSAPSLAGIPVPTHGADGTWHFKFPASADVTGNLCSTDAAQLKARLRQAGVTPGTAGMVTLDGGNNAAGTATICALGF